MTLRAGLWAATLVALLLAAACDDDEATPSTPTDNNGAADVGADGNNGAEDAGDASSNNGAPDVAVDADEPEVEPWWRDDVDHTLRAGPVSFPARGSISEDSGKGSFTFGAATASTQIEDQNANVDWAAWTAPLPEGLGIGTALGEASRGYRLAMEDLGLLEELGLDAYRFSIEWSRVEPARDQIDEEALAHYSALIDGMVARGITPVITIHHFSNPIWIDDPRDVACANGPTDANLCGWNHPTGGSMVVDEVAEFAGLLGERFGDRVDVWCTVNEPVNYLFASYGAGVFPPGKRGLFDLDVIFVPAFRNYLAAHAKIYDALKAADTVDADGDGEAASVGFTHAVARWAPTRDHARSNAAEDINAVHRIEYLYHLLFVDSILQGGFDPELDGTLSEPHPEWAGKLDWLGVQYYFRTGVTGKNGILPRVEVTPCTEGLDFGACIEPEDPTWYVPDMEYEFWAPGLYELLVEFSQRWPNLPMTVTESGIATGVGRRRAEHIVRTLEQIWRAVEAGVDVRGYFHWSLYDNFEWAKGYTPHFGLYAVDFAGDYSRTATEGATIYSQITGDRALTEPLRAEYGGMGPMTPER